MIWKVEKQGQLDHERFQDDLPEHERPMHRLLRTLTDSRTVHILNLLGSNLVLHPPLSRP